MQYVVAGTMIRRWKSRGADAPGLPRSSHSIRKPTSLFLSVPGLTAAALQVLGARPGDGQG